MAKMRKNRIACELLEGATNDTATLERSLTVSSQPDWAAIMSRGTFAICPTEVRTCVHTETCAGVSTAARIALARVALTPVFCNRRVAGQLLPTIPCDTTLQRKGPAVIPRTAWVSLRGFMSEKHQSPKGAYCVILRAHLFMVTCKKWRPGRHRWGLQEVRGMSRRRGRPREPGDARTSSASRLGRRVHEPHRTAATHADGTREAGRTPQIDEAHRRRWPRMTARCGVARWYRLGKMGKVHKRSLCLCWWPRATYSDLEKSIIKRINRDEQRHSRNWINVHHAEATRMSQITNWKY